MDFLMVKDAMSDVAMAPTSLIASFKIAKHVKLSHKEEKLITHSMFELSLVKHSGLQRWLNLIIHKYTDYLLIYPNDQRYIYATSY